MFKWLLLLISMIFSVASFAAVDIDLACKEKKEQKMSLLSKMSTSVTEAHLAGQCTGYWSFDKVNLNKACSEFVEQKNALLSSLSTSLAEANLAGICIGAIYRVAGECGVNTSYINYSRIAEGSFSLRSMKETLGCGDRYGW